MKKIIWKYVCVAFTIVFLYVPVSAEKNTLTLGVKGVDVPENVLAYIEEQAPEILKGELADPEYYGISKDIDSDIYLMKPYIVERVFANGEQFPAESFSFPVISKEEVLFVIDVYEFDGELHYSTQNEMKEELTKLIGDDSCGTIYYYYSEGMRGLTTEVKKQTRNILRNPQQC